MLNVPVEKRLTCFGWVASEKPHSHYKEHGRSALVCKVTFEQTARLLEQCFGKNQSTLAQTSYPNCHARQWGADDLGWFCSHSFWELCSPWVEHCNVHQSIPALNMWASVWQLKTGWCNRTMIQNTPANLYQNGWKIKGVKALQKWYPLTGSTSQKWLSSLNLVLLEDTKAFGLEHDNSKHSLTRKALI